MSLQIDKAYNTSYKALVKDDKELLSINNFLTYIRGRGIQLKCMYEVNFSGIRQMSFLATSINMPSVSTRMADLSYYGRKVSVPILGEYEHNVSLTLMNDASGIVYPVVSNMVSTGYFNSVAIAGGSIGITAISDTKDESDDSYTKNGTDIVMNGVYPISVSGLDFSNSDASIQTFNVEFWVRDFDVKPRSRIRSSSFISDILNMFK